MFRRLLILWMLAATPLLQARTLMHCESMAEVEPVECCCHGGSVDVVLGDAPADCCDMTVVSIDPPQAVLVTTGTDEGFDDYPATGPPPTAQPRPFAAAVSLRMPALERRATPAPVPVWLSTGRLRI